jgi:GAF domain-containing protein/methyl-accepting chemotaxis protein
VILEQNPLSAETQPKPHSIRWLWISAIAALLFAGSELVELRMSGNRQFWAVLPVFLAVPIAYWLIRTGRQVTASITFIAAIGLQSIFTTLVRSGLGLPNSITSLALIGGICLMTMPNKYIGRVLTVSMMIAFASVLIDLFGNPGRPVAGLGLGRWIFSFVMLAIFAILFAREFPALSLRAKIVTGIIGTGVIALSILVVFALYQSRQITNTLSQRLDTSVNQLAEEQLINRASTEANQANQAFEDISEEVISLSLHWASLKRHNDVLDQGLYWDATANLTQLAGGQHGNSGTDPSSVFVPAGVPVDASVTADLNTSAYLDFDVPEILQTHPSVLAIYAIDTRGVIRYFPNIKLATLLPPDFDATQRPYFVISSPLYNPQHGPRWTIPYIDAAGGGLVVTVAVPIYENNRFSGVVAADMKLDQVANQISLLRIGKTGYAFMIDDAGRILSMPAAGYDMFGISPQDMNSEDFFKQSILGAGTDQLQAVTKRMTSGGDGLLTVDFNGADTYVSFYPVKSTGYSIALVVPVSELQGAIISANNQTQQQFRSASQVAAILLIALLAVSVAISFGVGRIIAAPIQRLTQVASQISAGDLNTQAAISTSDEIGTLAFAFNTMTARLRETLDGLEQMVERRTTELLSANEKNERRAKQFESIAHIARTISSTRDLDILLSQITSAINREFGFYHIGVFLMDASKEYAVLSAANSEGGKKMLERGHRLKVAETGLVGYVTGTGKPRIALDIGADAIFFNNPDLPLTRSEVTLPLRAGEEIIGALDVQSTEANAFTTDDINILSTLAEQVSIAIQNAQQFEQTRQALNESEILSRQFVQSGWQQFTKHHNLLGIRHTGARTSLVYKKNGRNEERSDDSPSKINARGAFLSLPIKLRGEVIGSVDVHAPDGRPWDQDELDIVTAIIERAAIAMENARLLAESQKRAAKERTIGEIASKISIQSDINELLKTAAQELGRTLPGAEIAIQFNKDTE